MKINIYENKKLLRSVFSDNKPNLTDIIVINSKKYVVKRIVHNFDKNSIDIVVHLTTYEYN